MDAPTEGKNPRIFLFQFRSLHPLRLTLPPFSIIPSSPPPPTFSFILQQKNFFTIEMYFDHVFFFSVFCIFFLSFKTVYFLLNKKLCTVIPKFVPYICYYKVYIGFSSLLLYITYIRVGQFRVGRFRELRKVKLRVVPLGAK